MTTTAEPTASFRELLANPHITDDTDVVITAGELRTRLDELGRLRTQADEDAAVAAWCLHSNEPREIRTAILSNHFGARAQAVLDKRMAALPEGEPRDGAAQLAALRTAVAATPADQCFAEFRNLHQRAGRIDIDDLPESDVQLLQTYHQRVGELLDAYTAASAELEQLRGAETQAAQETK